MLALATGHCAPGLKSEDESYAMYLTMVRATSRILDEACSTRPADLAQVELLKELAFGFFEPNFSGRYSPAGGAAGGVSGR
jgi:hypothetical protein